MVRTPTQLCFDEMPACHGQPNFAPLLPAPSQPEAMEPQHQHQPLELRHLPSPELAELADLMVALGGGSGDAGGAGAGATSALPLHSHVLATGSALFRGVFSSTEVGDKESRERAVQQALAAEAPADVLAFLSLLYDPVHVKEAMTSPFAAAAPASPTKPTAAAAAGVPHMHLAAATAGTAGTAAGGLQAQPAAAAAPAVSWGAAAAPVANVPPLWPGAAAALQQGGGAGASAPFNFAVAPAEPVVPAFQFGSLLAAMTTPAAGSPANAPAAAALALGRRAEAVLRLADKLDCSLVVEVCAMA